jgi:cytochrome c biogenesis protein CcdA
LSAVIYEWYAALSQLYAAAAEPFMGLARSAALPHIAALVLGLLATLAPCQLTTNAAAIAWVARDAAAPRRAALAAGAFIAGKALVYTLFGVAAVLIGQGLQAAAVPVFVAARKALGPLMIAIGLVFLGLLPWRLAFGARLAARLKPRLPQGSVAGGFGLGAAFAFAFCPTLALLFFTFLLPLTLATSGGFVLPGFFALGTMLPLALFTALLFAGAPLAQRYVRGSAALDKSIRAVAGVIFLVAGVNDTVLYWTL